MMGMEITSPISFRQSIWVLKEQLVIFLIM